MRVRILSRLKENKELKEEERRGTHTSGVVIEIAGRKIATYTNGLPTEGEMGILVEPPRDAGGSVRYFTMLRDPDGHLVEFTNGQPIEGLY
jgi:hypothetical protein